LVFVTADFINKIMPLAVTCLLPADTNMKEIFSFFLFMSYKKTKINKKINLA